jgi:hypothetical protein
MTPKCSDEWSEDYDEAVVDLVDAIARIEWREDLADDFDNNYEEEDKNDGN